MAKNYILMFLCFVLALIGKNHFWPNTTETASTNTKPVKQNNSEMKEEVAAEYSDGLQEVHVYNKNTGDGVVVYRKKHQIERRTRNIKFVQKSNTRDFDSPKEYDNFAQREAQQKKRIEDVIKADVRKEQRERQKQKNLKYKNRKK
ncbi:hypothetical protein [Candidatus Uabimicrobium amorphum]|uniref:Uncharacterized protein n=1 Tax=Uabimicrobium amorphum TaxID=2596890 RepID=A0A5S9F2R3_UABAM|nr:hypothetical protein [Candidatus Uabimicrobium amorphum]BBM83947.1 hypothetical protein UABAM_02302 [Candidatus Uabimicrobium amorphum]